MSETLDVALLLGQFGTGGVERVACHLANGFVENGHRTEMVVARRRGPAIDLVHGDVPIVALGKSPFSILGRGAALLGAIPSLTRYLRKRQPKILLSPGNHTHMAAAIAHSLAAGRTDLVIKITNPILKKKHGRFAHASRRLIYRWIFSRAKLILLLSPHGLQQVEEISPQALGKARVVHNPYIDEEIIRGSLDLPSTGNSLGTARMILAVGRLTKQKNYKLLLRAVARITEQDWRLVFLGEGPQEAELRQLVEQLGLTSRVEFAGFVSNPMIYYAVAHSLALSSNYEDLPAVLLEALAAGMPVVATECSEAVASIMQAANHGELVPLRDEAAFAAALSRVLGSPVERKPFVGAMDYTIVKGVADHLHAIQSILPPEIMAPESPVAVAQNADRAIA